MEDSGRVICRLPLRRYVEAMLKTFCCQLKQGVCSEQNTA
jgi:hypothetical protein